MAPFMFYVESDNAVINVFFTIEIKFFTSLHSLAFCAAEREKTKKSEHENFGESLTTLYLAIKISEKKF